MLNSLIIENSLLWGEYKRLLNAHEFQVRFKTEELTFI